MIRTLVLLLTLVGTAASPALGQRALSAVARDARDALARGDLDRLVRTSPGVQLQLPGVEPSTALGPAQAAATLRRMFRRGETASVSVEGFGGEVGTGRAYVELKREFRTPGVEDRRVQRVLIGYRLVDGEWKVVDVRVN